MSPRNLVFNRSFCSFSATSPHSERHHNSSNAKAGFTYWIEHKFSIRIEADLTFVRVLQPLFRRRYSDTSPMLDVFGGATAADRPRRGSRALTLAFIIG
jgi:hypothetical protein